MTSGCLALYFVFVLGWFSHCLWIWAKDWPKDKEGGAEYVEKRNEEENHEN